MLRLFSFPRPLVAALDGHAIAGGFIIACACDFRVSNGQGTFGMNEVTNGMSVAETMMEIMRTALSPKLTSTLLLTGRMFKASEGRALGVIDEIAAPDQVSLFLKSAPSTHISLDCGLS
jgi:enoyl-CoA hydratase